jgi:hypothetical protein
MKYCILSNVNKYAQRNENIEGARGTELMTLSAVDEILWAW